MPEHLHQKPILEHTKFMFFPHYAILNISNYQHFHHHHHQHHNRHVSISEGRTKSQYEDW
jgi:hypothetical protein